MDGNMRLVSINAGVEETIRHGAKTMTTGIRKNPVDGEVFLSASGIERDAIVDTRHHGGADQALYAYSADDYDWWAEATGREFPPGMFGENLTIRGLPSNMTIGDRLLIGDVVLEATSARIPCRTLAVRLEDDDFGKAFRRAERPGIYFRVLNEGHVRGGDAVTLIETMETDVTTLDLFRYAFALQHDANELRRFLAAPLAERVRADVESRLQRLEATD